MATNVATGADGQNTNSVAKPVGRECRYEPGHVTEQQLAIQVALGQQPNQRNVTWEMEDMVYGQGGIAARCLVGVDFKAEDSFIPVEKTTSGMSDLATLKYVVKNYRGHSGLPAPQLVVWDFKDDPELTLVLTLKKNMRQRIVMPVQEIMENGLRSKRAPRLVRVAPI